MKKLILFTVTILGILIFIAATYLTPQKQNLVNQPTSKTTLSPGTITNLESRGFEVAGQYFPVRSPCMLDSTNLPETIHLKMSLDVRQAKNLQITWLGTPATQKIATSQNDTILVEGFEGDFPGANWQLSGDPTWGKSNYTQHSGQNSVFCAKGGTAGVTPPTNYPNDMNAMMVFGPFDLSNASLAFVRFWYWLETELNKDWFWYMASLDGVNFYGISVSGSTGTSSPTWEQTSLNLADVPDLGSLIGQSSVWIAFGFSSDSTGAKRGAFVDDVEVQKAAVGTGISGYLKGSLISTGNPYIAFDHVGVAQGDSLEILPGTEIRFYPAKEFVVQGLLDARGTEIDSLRFTSNNRNPKPGDWVGIGFYDTASESCVVQFSKIEYGGNYGQLPGGIYSECMPRIKNNLIILNKGSGVVCTGKSLIIQNTILNNDIGINAFSGNPSINNNMISQNKGGIELAFSTSIIENNKILNNSGGGIGFFTANPKIINNQIRQNGSNGIAGSNGGIGIEGMLIISGNEIIDNNGHGIFLSSLAIYGDVTQNVVKGNNDGIHLVPGYCGAEPGMRIYNNTLVANKGNGMNFEKGDLSSTPILNNIITQNVMAGIYSEGENNSMNILYNNVFYNSPNYKVTNQDSLGKMVLRNMKGDSCDIFYNIGKDPLFRNPQLEDYRLQYIENGFPNDSPCRDAGNYHIIFNDIDNSQNDIGYTGGSRLFISHIEYDFGEREIGLSKEFNLLEFYNDRSSTISISNLILTDSNNFSVKPNSAFEFRPFNKISFFIVFSPKITGEIQSNLFIISNTGFFGGDTAFIKLSGKGIAATIINDGNVSGIWTRDNNPYIITGQAKVPKGDSLIIKPGVFIKFEGYRSTLQVQGKLKAIGTASDSITITNNLYGACLEFINSDTGSVIEYCIIKNADRPSGYDGGGIYCQRTSIIVRSSAFINNKANSGGAIYLTNSSAHIENNRFLYNSAKGYFYRNEGGGAIYCVNSSVRIYRNSIKSNWAVNNAGGIVSLNSFIVLKNNLISTNTCNYFGSGVYVKDSRIECVNNIIYKNGSYSFGAGFDLSNSSGIIENCIIRENYSDKPKEVAIDGIDSLLIIKYNNVKDSFKGEGNIDSDPFFVDLANAKFHLLSNSPCIDVGDPDSIYNDPEDPNNPGYALYPAMGTTRNDMGAYGGPGAASYPVNQAPKAFNLLFPNDQDTIFTSHPTLNWQAAIDPNPGDVVTYMLYYDADSSFANAAIVSGIATPSVQLHYLKDHRSYFWKVKAEDSHGASTFSNQVFQFYAFAAPLIFKLLYPAAEDTVTTDTLSFSWQSAFDPNPADTIRYIFLCDSSRSFIKPITVTGISDTSFTFINSLNNNTRYYWTIMAVDKDSFTTASSDTFNFLVRYRPTGVAGEEGSELPTEFALSQNYPNPFNAQTTIKYQLPMAQEVKLAIYNLRGQRVATLVDRKEAADYYSIIWDGRDEQGNHVASGVYLYRFETERFVKVRKLVLLR